MVEDFDERLLELLNNNRSGSRLIASRAAKLMGDIAAEEGFSRTELIGRLRRTCRRLEKAHASMRTVRALCDDVVLILDSKPSAAELRRRLCNLFDRWDEQHFSRILKQVFSHAYPLLRDVGIIVSHSYSTTALGVLLELAQNRPEIKVIQSISAPVKEGIGMAHLLANEEIAVELIADAGLASAVERADAVLVGADGVGLSGVVNKLGTFGLALAAAHFGIPMYAAFDSSKLLPPGWDLEIKRRNPAELASTSDDRVEVINVYFDVTPLEMFTALIMEEGAFTPGELRGVLEELKPGQKY